MTFNPNHLASRRRVLQAAGAAAATVAAPGWVRAQTEGPIVVGQTASLTGPLAFPFVEMNKGIKAAFDEFNERGGVDGRRIEFVSLDDAGSPEKAAANAKQLIEQNKILSFFACGGTTSVLGLMPVAQQAKVPLISPATGIDALRVHNPLVIHTRTGYSTEIAKIAQHLSTTTQTKCAVVYNDNPFSKAGLAAFEAAAKRYNNTDWKPFVLGPSPDDIPKLVAEIAAWGPTSIMSLHVGGIGVAFYKALREKVPAAPYVLSIVGTKPLMDALGEAAKGTTVAQIVPNPENSTIAVVRAYQNAMKKAGVAPFSYSSLEGYVASRILFEGLRRAGRHVTRDKLVPAFETMRPYDLGGYEVSYGPRDHEGSNFVELTYYNGERFRR
ncbi:ABC transporter substrate-binding protein [Aquabacterium sp. A7-Y]|uniref:ABC transporter substrate-binding protein n=1 Tax=Aquabacterium sp. A7-Y TaxID=1349605 RepID=UPI00223CA743|nr:ABC transporter substrate-binding protein [Aquabacterium sp. A7-Y]MCW7541701.1 ABC transporter substrate-binding protein [Aquabacterium sp. A7-Y]